MNNHLYSSPQDDGTTDLSGCDRELIHIPGMIQPHGYLLTINNHNQICTISRNLLELCGKHAGQLRDNPLHSVFDTESCAIIHAALASEDLMEMNPLKLSLTSNADPARKLQFYGILHRVEDHVVIELESESDWGYESDKLYHYVQKSIEKLQSAGSLEELYKTVVDEVRHLTGYDRVMMYMFHSDWHGEVIAESKQAQLNPFLGLHYPASDIPAQARRLYQKNWLRVIPDVSYQPVPLEPSMNRESGMPLDMSSVMLRSVSPVHLEYLGNMGVKASMSISLMRDGSSLWGLLACHHGSPKYLPYSVRVISTLLGQTISILISARARVEDTTRIERIEKQKVEIIRELSEPGDSDRLMARLPSLFLDALGAEGVGMFVGRNYMALGNVPDETQVRELSQFLDSKSRQDLFQTSGLSTVYPAGQEFTDRASGVLSIPIGGELSRDRVLWFRAEWIRHVNWAGQPQKETVVEAQGVRLSPRKSFAKWTEVIRGRGRDWTALDCQIATSLIQSYHELIIKQARDIENLNRRLLESERAKDDFMAVLSHELRTPLNSILGWIEILKDRDDGAVKRKEIYETIHRNAGLQKQLIDDLLDVSRIVSGTLRLSPKTFELEAVVKLVLDIVRNAAQAKDIQIQFHFDPKISPMIGDPYRIQQVLWNLLSNSIKFTPPGGRVVIEAKDRETCIELVITDNGQGIQPDFLPHVFERFQQADGGSRSREEGLGLGLHIVQHIVKLHGGEVRVSSEGKGKGSCFTVELPKNFFAKAEPDHAQLPTKETQANAPLDFKNMRVLVVEDSPDPRFLLEDIMNHSGAATKAVESAESALALLDSEPFDLLISDIGMPGMDGIAFIRELRTHPKDRGGAIPAIALTAYARNSDRDRTLEAGFNGFVSKPLSSKKLLAVVAQVLRQPPSMSLQV